MLRQIHQEGSMGWNIKFPPYVTLQAKEERSHPHEGARQCWSPFSLKGSAKEQFSVPVKASQGHIMKKPAGKASNYTSPSSMVSHTFPLLLPH